MKKIPSLFLRNFDHPSAQVKPIVTPGCEWVFTEGVATLKRDGTACLFRAGSGGECHKLYKRYDAKRGKQPPPGFEPAQDPDPKTGHWPGWVAVDLDNPAPEDVWHALAYWQTQSRDQDEYDRGGGKEPRFYTTDWTFELCGPRINSNAEKLSTYEFFAHGSEPLIMLASDRTFDGLKLILSRFPHEGIVFWRDKNDPDCDKAKITRSMFGFEWPIK